ncbi:MAG: aminotransferase class III-fold pyridoxal phosphate-dependent enzyme, partial [Bacteroidota bacterium]
MLQLTQLLKDHYGIKAQKITPLPGEVDLNYLFKTEEAAYLLKISYPDGNPSAVEFETAIMNHLAQRKFPFKTPLRVGNVTPMEHGRLARLQTWVPGRTLSEVNPITRQLRGQWGTLAGHLSTALADFSHPDAPTDYRWNPSQCLEARSLRTYLTEAQGALADYFWTLFEETTLPHLGELRQSINYNDAHGDNLLVDDTGQLSGLIDFGDAMLTHTLNELAIACAYAGMNVPDPLGAMREVVAGYHAVFPLREEEFPHLFSLITGRLLLTVTAAVEKAVSEPDNAYLQVSAAPAWTLLTKLRQVSPVLAEATFRAAAAVPLPSVAFPEAFPVVDLTGKRVHPMDLGVGSRELGHYRNYEDLDIFTRHVRRILEDAGADFGVGGYGETRPVYTTDAFANEGNYGPRWRTVHLGLDVWGPAGTPVYAPYDGVVHSVAIDPAPGSYGPTILLEHEGFYTLYGHLSEDSVRGLAARTRVQKGDEIARFGAPDENGDWPPHLHFQVMRDTLGYVGDFPGVAYPEEADAWLNLCPDPSPFLGTSPSSDEFTSSDDLATRRRRVLGYGLSVSYARPLHIVRGVRQYLLDVTGRRYLDTVNNVAHVGHEHPAVVEALQRQAAVLNTNSRYLHEEVLLFAEELTATLPPELSVVHFVNSGSEANELALRMCETRAGTRNMLALEIGYHGNTGRTIDVSSYKFDGKGGQGAPPQTTLVPIPDVFRGHHRDPTTAGRDYAVYVRQAIVEAEQNGKLFGGFIAESILSCGGQIVLPEGYLREVYAAIHSPPCALTAA